MWKAHLVGSYCRILARRWPDEDQEVHPTQGVGILETWEPGAWPEQEAKPIGPLRMATLSQNCVSFEIYQKSVYKLSRQVAKSFKMA